METLEKKLHEAQTKLTEKNSEQERERRGLNKQVTELEAYLKEEQNTHHSVTEDMREEIKKKSCELQQLIQEKGQLIENLNHAQEEVGIQSRVYLYLLVVGPNLFWAVVLT